MGKERIEEFVKRSANELLEQRRWFHQHPETSYEEIETGKYIIEYLTDLGITEIQSAAKTGVIATIGKGGKTIACRFNMDGLPIEEKTGLEYSSLFNGFSHACGHDFELAWGLLIAKYFTQHKPEHTLKLIFQPAEEGPGDEGKCRTGGQFLAEEGFFDVDAVFSLHVEPLLPIRTVSIMKGEVTCDAYDFEILMQGKMGHAAKPKEAINPVHFAGEAITKINALEKRINDNIDDGFAIITVSDISSRKNGNPEPVNTIPEFTVMKGITRFRSQKAREMVLGGLQDISNSYKKHLTNIDLILQKRAIATVNDQDLVANVKKAIEDFGFDHNEQRTTWRDDAGWASEKAPTAHGFIGVKQDNVGNLHSPYFNPSEKGLEVGLKVFLSSLTQSFNQ